MRFTKLHGTGNDFILINQFDKKRAVNLKKYKRAALKLCDRHYGIGADGLITVLPSDNKENDFKMRIFNADGSEAEMCGNGIRCFAHYVYSNKLIEKKKLRVETKAGLIKPEIIEYMSDSSQVKVDMGQPSFLPAQIPIKLSDNREWVSDYEIKVDDKKFKINCVSMGNPHTIIFKDDFSNLKLKQWGSQIENLSIFPQKTNVEFVKINNEREIEMKVWERGSGITLACGTGACGAAAAAVKKGLLKKGTDIIVKLPGGKLTINWSKDKSDSIKMTGPAVEVFTGDLRLKNILRGDENGNS